MKLPAGWVGTTAGPLEHAIDARWLMAYAAALGATDPAYLDTTRPGGIAAHPLFPVCFEWPAALALRAALPPAVAERAVHATHDLTIHRPPRPGDWLATTAVVRAVRARRAGAFVLARFETVDAIGLPVSTTDYGTLYRDVVTDGEGPDLPVVEAPPAPGAAAPVWRATVPVPAHLAHVYTECARIWNPIHTDRAVALAAGLPGVILHGTATLALALGEVLRRDAGVDPGRVRRIAGTFGAMVVLPSALTVEGSGGVEGPDGRRVAFRVLTDAGAPAVRDGWVLLA